jgi:cytoplasmic iron level regulating protein YaaA (DUF328/UPF0246 family)
VLLLLPPSETKRDGGVDGATLDLALLSFPSLTPSRRAVLAATRRLARNLSTMAGALKLGKSQHFELIRNRTLGSSPTMPAIERYTGVLYDALDVAGLGAAARVFAAEHVVIHSALFGLIGAADPIPAYRLSHDSRMPGLSLKKTWREPIAAAIASRGGLTLDLRSEAYVELGPPPTGCDSYFLRVVAEADDGRRRALNHFNKKGKGEFLRAVISAGLDHADVESLLAWATEEGIALSLGSPGELELVVPEIVASR